MSDAERERARTTHKLLADLAERAAVGGAMHIEPRLAELEATVGQLIETIEELDDNLHSRSPRRHSSPVLDEIKPAVLAALTADPQPLNAIAAAVGRPAKDKTLRRCLQGFAQAGVARRIDSRWALAAEGESCPVCAAQIGRGAGTISTSTPPDTGPPPSREKNRSRTGRRPGG